MTELQFPFTASGFLHELVFRKDDVCFVLRSKNGIRHYEVVVLQHSPERTFPDGRTLPERETYPSSETWGIYGFTFPEYDADKAIDKYFAVAAKQALKEESNSDIAE